jgi:hypothetical protein
MAQAQELFNYNQYDNLGEEVFVIEEPDVVYRDDDTIGSPQQNQKQFDVQDSNLKKMNIYEKIRLRKQKL